MTDDTRNIPNEIREGLEEALDFVKGRPTEGRITYMFQDKQISPREIREDQLGLTRQQFEEMFVIKVPNQRSWETGRRSPMDEVLAFYLMIKENPKAVYKMLHGKPMPRIVH